MWQEEAEERLFDCITFTLNESYIHVSWDHMGAIEIHVSWDHTSYLDVSWDHTSYLEPWL